MWCLVLSEQNRGLFEHLAFLDLDIDDFSESGKAMARSKAEEIWTRRKRISDGPGGHKFASVRNPRLCWIDPNPIKENQAVASSSIFDVLNQSDEELDAKLSVCLEGLEREGDSFINMEVSGIHDPDCTAEQ